jgi:hypothetical protein
MGLLACLGIGLLIVALSAAVKARSWLLLLIFVTPGALLGIEGTQGQVGLARSLAIFMMFFAIGALVIGAPLAALYWRWSRARALGDKMSSCDPGSLSKWAQHGRGEVTPNPSLKRRPSTAGRLARQAGGQCRPVGPGSRPLRAP